MQFVDFYREQEQEWTSQGLRRNLQPPKGIDFCSNDYLALSQSQAIKESWLSSLGEISLGSTGSRLLRGQTHLSDQLEQALANWGKANAALFFPSGYQANLSLLSALLKERAMVFSDERIHASMIDGIRLARAKKFIFKHNAVEDLRAQLELQGRSDHLLFVCVESVYSMTGQLAPLRDLVEVCESYGAHLIVDEAHAVGLFGPHGEGRVVAEGLESSVFARVLTAGKALGSAGAWVLGSQDLRDFLIQKSRGFIYSTAPLPGQQLMILKTLEHFQETGAELIAKYRQGQSQFQEELKSLAQVWGLPLLGMGSPISSLVLGENARALQVAQDCQLAGFDVRAIRPPTVPQGEALLRLTCPLSRTEVERASLIRVLHKVLDR